MDKNKTYWEVLIDSEEFDKASAILLTIAGLTSTYFTYNEKDDCYYAPARQNLDDGTRPRIRMVKAEIPDENKDSLMYYFQLYLGDWTDETMSTWKDQSYIGSLGYTNEGVWTF